jgi:signal transduction histidine kinase
VFSEGWRACSTFDQIREIPENRIRAGEMNMAPNSARAKYPILNRLVAAQLFTLLSGLAIIYSVYRSTYNAQITAAISRLKNDATPTLVARQEQWRAWKYLGMDSALNEEIAQVLHAKALRSLKVIPRSALPSPLPLSTLVFPETLDDPSGLVLYAEVDTDQVHEILQMPRAVAVVFGAVALVLLVSVLLSGRYVYVSIYMPIQRVSQALHRPRQSGQDPLDLRKIPATGEMTEFVLAIDGLLKQTQAYEKQAAVLEVASQVSHDIRSPLAALNVVFGGLDGLEEDHRVIARSAIARIEDIANNLLQKNRDLSAPELPSAAEPVLIAGLVESIISEKRLQFRALDRIRIELRTERATETQFALAQPGELRRAVSNLINNAIEAIEGQGKVEVTIAAEGSRLAIRVRDDGRGIPSAILERLGTRGTTFGKPGGSGLGLHHARECVRRWGGDLKLQSEEGSGTTVTLELSIASPPSWFAERIGLDRHPMIAVLDDDPSVHQVWRARAPSRTVHFTSPEDLLTWWRGLPLDVPTPLLLTDYELKARLNGLDVIERLGVSSGAILVTSSYDDPRVQLRSLRLGARVLPKHLAGSVALA